MATNPAKNIPAGLFKKFGWLFWPPFLSLANPTKIKSQNNRGQYSSLVAHVLLVLGHLGSTDGGENFPPFVFELRSHYCC